MPSTLNQKVRRRKILEEILKDKGVMPDLGASREAFRENGPVYMVEKLQLTVKGQPIILSEDQVNFLNDLFIGKVRYAIIVAGRGAGKTLILALYILWRLISFDNWDLSALGGSAEQSERIQEYITEWERRNDFVKSMIMKNVKGSVVAKNYNECRFLSCSGTSVRGPHVKELIIDEVAAAEEAGNEKYIRAALWEVSTSKEIRVILTSTAHYIFGMFLEIWNNTKQYGYTPYHWAIARHKSGIEDIYSVYRHKTGWLPNLPWFSDEAISFLRKNSSDDEWLVEALGGIAMASGTVINPEDLKACVCEICEICTPYLDKCVWAKILPSVTERFGGIDWGDISPFAITIVGRLQDKVYVLFSNELVGLRENEQLQYIQERMKEYNTDIALPDPENYALNNMLGDMGITVHRLFSVGGGNDKAAYVSNTKRHFENKIILIPKAYEKLIKSTSQIVYDKKGKIRKINDHSWDSMIYGLSEYWEDKQKLYEITKEGERQIKMW